MLLFAAVCGRSLLALRYFGFPSWFDTLNTVFFDTHRGDYVLFSRANLHPKTGRSFQLSRSPDLVHWGPHTPIRTLWAGGTLGAFEQLYTINAQPLPGAEHIYVATPVRCGHSWMSVDVAFCAGAATGKD